MGNLADGSSGQTEDLEALARSRFGELSEAEHKLLRAAPGGEVARCGPSPEDEDPANDPAKADGWGGERKIRADLLRWLLVDREAASRIDPRGIQVHAAKVTGNLDLSFATVPFPLALWRCRLTDDADLTSAQIPGLCLDGSWTRSVAADRMNVADGVFLRNGFTAEGGVRLLGTQIGGDLSCIAGTFKNPGGSALHADGVNVVGSVFLRNGFMAEGEVRLLGGQIGRNVECDGGSFKNSGGHALSADRMNVTDSVFLRNGFTADGEVGLVGAQIGGDLDCIGGTFSALNAQTTTIKGNLLWRGVKNAEGAGLDLRNASAGSIVDDEASWPKQRSLRLDGFTYTRISDCPTDAKTRLEWLDRLDRFTLQPYRQLAKVLRETGDDRGARRVLFEMEQRRREEQKRNWLWRVWSWVLRWTIGYGQMPARALAWLLVLLVTGFVLSSIGYFSGAMVPTEKEAHSAFEQKGQLPAYYPRFHALVYSLEHSFPFVNLGQKDHWTPDPQSQSPSPLRDARFHGVCGLRFPFPGVLRWWLWFQILAGWLLATLFVAGLTGVVRIQ